MSSVDSKQAVVFVIIGTILGLLIGMSLPSVTADHEAEISTLNSRLSALNITLKSIFEDKTEILRLFLTVGGGNVFLLSFYSIKIL